MNVSVVEQCGCADSFLNLMSVFLASLSPSTLALLEPLRPYAHRFISFFGQFLGPLFQTGCLSGESPTSRTSSAALFDCSCKSTFVYLIETSFF